ncbi:Steroid C26-monooxygenase [Streptomyces sp. MBT84]|nr:Steroid C26-monooxygenase [Streptomyces sp. MBT84]
MLGVAMSCPALPDGFDFTDPDVLHHHVPLPEFAALRLAEPVRWIPQAGNVAGFQDEGYWAVTRHADVKYVSTHPEIFSSSLNTAIIRFNQHIERDAIDAQRLIMLNMDPPEHTRVRQIVQRGFTRVPSLPWRSDCAPVRTPSSRAPSSGGARSTSSPRSPASCPSRPSPS